ncbi:MAG: PP2C family protein-serine/threonine phosphatase [Arthrobacter sp.]|uniref:PP2C family protein-serine/threonine phosphatase n=1 Tax=unclassified Arthrobacter TaxID=235627 RepID=UPI002650BE83|nr:protein phosphatase 2C domain-containing protein [Micrococcaceae bacterium]MDN5811681.1 protein phosphatase 2C domain-containing protein [Micrococcaceae bacterium]MDN5825486.1 protein phosphatase 2C domain-containing protein [Micrococcaceae bacterium]MDN5879945.1 protein phosphatase 2C domain-containing protein [Micrococcaceae bacterium]MDN5885991.1 protein phosphatase 2C domain-containing protein [Micrococcaceae bacterium]
MSGAVPRPSDGQVALEVGLASDRGLRRPLNEDSVLAERHLFAVADGMGGHEAGEVASSICVATFAQGQEAAGDWLTPEDLQQFMVSADLAIREAAASRAGTTVTGAALVRQGEAVYWLVFNVGDSRTYLLSGDQFRQVTVDHSEVQEMVDRGEITAQEALTHPRRNVITRALGTGEDSEADFWMLPARPGDRLLICSDGLTNEVGDGAIRDVLLARTPAQIAVDDLLQAALRSGGRDNISLVIVDVELEHDDDEFTDTAPRDAIESDHTQPRPEDEGQ